jgi:hypothetical protein
VDRPSWFRVLFSVGGYALVVWVSVGLCLAASVLASRLAEARAVRSTRDELSYLAELRAAFSVAAESHVRVAVLVVVLVTGLDTIDEYFPLPARDWGVPTDLNPLALLGIPLVGAVGSALGGIGSRLRPWLLASVLGAAALLLGLAGMVHQPAGLFAQALAVSRLERPDSGSRIGFPRRETGVTGQHPGRRLTGGFGERLKAAMEVHVNLDDAVGELYALSPDDFTGRRTELAAQAKENGDRSLASEIGKLRRPTIAAWLVNRLARERVAELDALLELAQQLRDAHRQVDGARIRELSSKRQDVLQAITESASDIADRPVGDSVLQQVRQTFEAAIADERAEAAAVSGQLTTALSYSGFGEVDLTEATALPSSRRHLRVVKTPPSAARPMKPAGVDRKAAAIAAAEAAVTEAQQAAAEWAHESMSAAASFDRAKQEHDELVARIAQLEEDLAQARTRAREAEAALRSVRHTHENAEQRLNFARRKVDEAQAKLDRVQQ